MNLETEQYLIIAAVVIASVIIGAVISYFTVGMLMKVTSPPVIIVDSPPPVCQGEFYTPGTCGVNSNMTFTQCKVNTTGRENGT